MTSQAPTGGTLDPPPVLWDAHACLPLRPDQDLTPLERHRRAGVTYVSINVGMDFNPVDQVVRVIAGFRGWLARHSGRFLLAETAEDIIRARRDGRLAVGFDLEGSAMLADDLSMLRLYRDLGVRQMLLAYNRDNTIAGGCHGGGQGLTALGKAVVREINALGMIMDCAHASKRASLEVMALSERPVVFSHANARALVDHPRNVDDEQIAACAATGGVIGLCGIGLFLGDDSVRTETLIRHITHVAERVGPRHIGLGLDYVFDQTHSDLPESEDPNRWWPRAAGYDLRTMAHIPPERFPEIADALSRRGWAGEDIAGVMGQNFLRVAEQTWPARREGADIASR